MSENIIFGKTGEDVACDFLRQNNYKILQKNYRSKLGEIDIVAEDRGTICFVEVKARHNNRFGSPQEAVMARKQKQIAKAALCFLKEHKFSDRSARFDVLSVDYSDSKPKIDLIKNAFDLVENYTY